MCTIEVNHSSNGARDETRTRRRKYTNKLPPKCLNNNLNTVSINQVNESNSIVHPTQLLQRMTAPTDLDISCGSSVCEGVLRRICCHCHTTSFSVSEHSLTSSCDECMVRLQDVSECEMHVQAKSQIYHTSANWRPDSSAWSSASAARCTNQQMTWSLKSILSIVFLLVACSNIAECCSSKSTPKPRPASPTLRPNVTFQTYTCPPNYAAWYCLNGATCFFVKVQDSILYNCECAEGYIGSRCEFKDLDGSYAPARDRVILETASIAGGACAVILVTVVLSLIYMFMQTDKRKQLKNDGKSYVADTPKPQMVCHSGSSIYNIYKNDTDTTPKDHRIDIDTYIQRGWPVQQVNASVYGSLGRSQLANNSPTNVKPPPSVPPLHHALT